MQMWATPVGSAMRWLDRVAVVGSGVLLPIPVVSHPLRIGAVIPRRIGLPWFPAVTCIMAQKYISDGQTEDAHMEPIIPFGEP